MHQKRTDKQNKLVYSNFPKVFWRWKGVMYDYRGIMYKFNGLNESGKAIEKAS